MTNRLTQSKGSFPDYETLTRYYNWRGRVVEWCARIIGRLGYSVVAAPRINVTGIGVSLTLTSNSTTPGQTYFAQGVLIENRAYLQDGEDIPDQGSIRVVQPLQA